MEKKKGFQMPHTYIIIFGVILFAALLTVFIPLGKYDTKEITYMQNGVEKTRTVLDPESFQYILDQSSSDLRNRRLWRSGNFKLCIRGYDRRR